MVSPFTQLCSCCRKLTMLCFKDQRNELQPLAFRSIARRALGPPPQTTVRVLVRYPKEAGGKVSVKTHCFVSDDGKHPNSLALKKCLRTLLQSTFIFALTDVVVSSTHKQDTTNSRSALCSRWQRTRTSVITIFSAAMGRAHASLNAVSWRLACRQ